MGQDSHTDGNTYVLTDKIHRLVSKSAATLIDHELFQGHGSQSASFCGIVFFRLHSLPLGPTKAQGGGTALQSCSKGLKADPEILRRQLQRLDVCLRRLGRLSRHAQQLAHQERQLGFHFPAKKHTI